MRRSVLLCGALAAIGCEGGHPVGCLDVLFIGNSHVMNHDVDRTTADIAIWELGPVEAFRQAEGGWALDDHVRDLGGDRQGWRGPLDGHTELDVVVIQENALVAGLDPDDPAFVASERAISELGERADGLGAEVVLFATWGRRDGEPGMYADYAEHQAGIDRGYERYREITGARVAPAGAAWQLALADPELPDLYEPDGIHASPTGALLASAVLARTLTVYPAAELPVPDDVDPAVAEKLYAIAEAVAE